MLTADLAIAWRRGSTVVPKYLDPRDARHLGAAEELIAILRAGLGSSRSDVDRAFDDFIGAGTDYKVIRGMIKLLLDRCLFETSSPVDPLELRRSVFFAARERHPAGADEATRAEVLAGVASRLALSPDAVERALYADTPANQRLVGFDEPTALDLVDEYNLAQAQALLYRAVRMTVRVAPQAPEGYRRLFDAIKAHRLVHAIRGDARSGYEVDLDGPVSMFHRSQKYGIQMAAFLPSLLACEGWSMRAEIEAKPRGTAWYETDAATTRLRAPSAERPDERRPLVEKAIAAASRAGDGWTAEPTAEVVDLGGVAFVPDAVARREDGAEVWIEVLGFWTPRHLSRRLAELERGGRGRFLLLASDELRASRDPLGEPPPGVLLFKSSPDARAVRAALAAATGGVR